MGRLGFNLVRPKEAAKSSSNVEAGAADQQNARNEHAEIGELILAIEEGNRKIKNLQLVISILTTVIIIILLSAYILLTQSRVFHSDQAEASESQQMLKYQADQMDLLTREYDELRVQNQEQQRNCSLEESAAKHLEQELATERSLREADGLESRRRYEVLHTSHEALQLEQEKLTSQCQEAQEELKSELRKLGDERADLERKLAEASRRLERRQTRQPKASPTTPVPTTTTPAPATTARSSAGGIFDTERFRKINDLVKDIETGAAIFDFREFMKKTDDVFRF